MVRLSDRISDSLALRAGKPGDIIFLGGRPLRRGEMYPDGRELSRALYPRLFAAIGTKWGAGNGSTTFNIPDLRGVVLAGRDTMGIRGNRRMLRNVGAGAAGIDSTVVGKQGGADRRTIDIANLPIGVMSRTPGFGTVISGDKTTGTGGDALRETTALTAPLSVVQPTAIFDYAILLGQDEIVIPPIPEPNTGTSDLEFNGPFADWLDVVADFAADPTGVEDSSDAIEAALAALFNSQIVSGSVADPDAWYIAAALYFPAGTYRITRTILLPNKATHPGGAEGFAIYGEDPRTTIIKWDGETDGTMMWMAGWHSGIVSRLTFHGSGTAARGIRIERDFAISLNQTNSRIADCFFQDMLRGIENTRDIPGASTDSEIDIARCRFYRCAEFGVIPTAAEAYDYWVRNCYFEACGVGIGRLTDAPYEDFTQGTFDVTISGSFSSYDNVFNGSLLYDIDMASGQNVDIIRNTSHNSNRFLRTIFANMTVSQNRVINPVQTDCLQIITQFGQLPSAIFALNEFKMRAGATGPIIKMLYDAGIDENRLTEPHRANDPRYTSQACYFFRNKFSTSYAGAIGYDPYYESNITTIEPELHNQTISEAPALISPVPPKVVRQVFYFTNTPVNGQSTINAAAAYHDANTGSRPVIYFPFFVDGARRETGEKTLVFPANKRMSLQGSCIRNPLSSGTDFDNTHNDKPLLVFRGPSRMTVQNFVVNSTQAGNKHGLHTVVDQCNQLGSRVYMEGCNGTFMFKETHNLSAYLVNHQVSPMGDLSFPSEVAGNSTAVTTGGVLLEGATGGIGAADPASTPMFHLKDGGQFWIRGYWYETSVVGQLTFKLEGSVQKGWLSVQSSRWRPGDTRFPPGPDKVHWKDIRQMTVNGWNGDMVLCCTEMIGRPTLLGNLSAFRYMEMSSWQYPFDDGRHFLEYEGVPLKIKGTIDDISGGTLPGSGTDGDTWYMHSSGHQSVWKDGSWHNIGGIVGTVQSVSNLNPAYNGVLGGAAGGVLDCFIVSDTNEVHQWNGTSWVNLASGMPMPAVFWHNEGAGTGIADQTQNWNLYKTYDSPPVNTGGDPLPADFAKLLDKMLGRTPPKFIEPLGDGLTDLRFYRFTGWVQYVPGTFTIPADP